MFSFFRKSDPNMWLLVGLGNPGDKYANNRHNVGFMAIDAIANGAVSFPCFKSKFQSEMSEANVAGTRLVLLKPQTFMNESGQAVRKAAQFYKIPPERIVVIHDELDLKPGEVRLKKDGGLAGHNGLKSIKAHIGTADFWRFRVGIGHPGEKSRVSGYVLSDFAKAEAPVVEAVEEAFSDHYETLSKEGIEAYAELVISHINRYLKEG